MIIKQLELTHFGKFNNEVVEFKPGMNIIYGENEAGKTTIHTFIRGMLFGIEKRRGKVTDKDIYTKYEPWEEPANYQGKMRIQENGVNYRIERIFAKANKDFIVINEDEGVELTEREISSLFAGLDESCYYNTISISQLGSVTDKELESILKNYAANLGATKTMDINIKGAIADLDAQRKAIASEKQINQEDVLKHELINARDKLDISEKEQHTIIAGIEQKKSELESMSEEKSELSIKDKKRFEEITKQNERREKLYQEKMNYRADVDKFETDLYNVREKKAELEESLKEEGIENGEGLDRIMTKVVKRTNFPIFLTILTVAFFGGAIGLFIGNYNAIMANLGLKTLIQPLICVGCGVLTLIGAIIRFFVNKKNKNKRLEEIKELRKVIEQYEAVKHEEAYMERQHKAKSDALNKTIILMKHEEENEIETNEYSKELEVLEAKERELRDGISKSQWMIEQKQERDIETRRAIKEYKERLIEIAKAKQEIEAIEEAKASIEEIATDIRNNFGKKLNERASYYMEQITNGKYDSVVIDGKLNISINSKHSLIPSGKLSKGTVEQVYMSLRLAAADIIFSEHPMPILLDDAFAMYDNKRMGNTMRFMATGMQQTIMFSCHTREKVMADRLGIDYNLIKL